MKHPTDLCPNMDKKDMALSKSNLIVEQEKDPELSTLFGLSMSEDDIN